MNKIMSINSALFLIFVAVTLILYGVIPQRFRKYVLFAASVFFYLMSSLRSFAFLLGTIILTYLGGIILDSMNLREKDDLARLAKEEKPAAKKAWQRKKRIILSSALAINFLTLAVFKYLDSWFAAANSFLSSLGLSFSFPSLELLLPLGISFYIFQTAGYLIDVYRGKTRAERGFLDYAIFACYFPQMIQGPINRYSELSPQLKEGKKLSAENIRSGILLMMWGMLKKVFIADVLSPGVTAIYSNYQAYPGIIIFLGASMYCLQLYADFSGGTDIIRGVSEMFGISLRENFKRPYFATSVDDFWRRWHISLGDWMKDYLFYPLALSGWLPRLSKKLRPYLSPRVGKLVTPSIATVIVFLMVGIWQGPGGHNIAYGLWNGLLMSGAMLLAPYFGSITKKMRIRENGKILYVYRILRTAFLVVIGRYFSRALSLTAAFGMLARTVTSFTKNLSLSSFFSFGLDKWDYLTVLISVLVLLTVSILQERGIKARAAFVKLCPGIQFILLFIAVSLLMTCVYLNSDYTAIAYVYENV